MYDFESFVNAPPARAPSGSPRAGEREARKRRSGDGETSNVPHGSWPKLKSSLTSPVARLRSTYLGSSGPASLIPGPRPAAFVRTRKYATDDVPFHQVGTCHSSGFGCPGVRATGFTSPEPRSMRNKPPPD